MSTNPLHDINMELLALAIHDHSEVSMPLKKCGTYIQQVRKQQAQAALEFLKPMPWDLDSKFMGYSLMDIRELITWLQKKGCDPDTIEDGSLKDRLEVWNFNNNYIIEGLKKDLAKMEGNYIRMREQAVTAQEKVVKLLEENERQRDTIVKMSSFEMASEKYAEIIDECIKRAPPAHADYVRYNQGIADFISCLQEYKKKCLQ